MSNAYIIWHVGGIFMKDGYQGGEVFDQLVDPDRLRYWCLLDHVKNELRQTGNIELYFRVPDKQADKTFMEGLQLVHNDATTCQLLSYLNEKKEVDMYVVVDAIRGAQVGQLVLCNM